MKVSEKGVERIKTSVTIPDVPQSVHEIIMQYRRKISLERGKDYSRMQAYTEWLIETTNGIELIP